MSDKPKDNIFCSFCGKTKEEVSHIIAGPSAYICINCIRESSRVLNEEAQVSASGDSSPNGNFNLRAIPTPKEIHRLLDEYVIDQEKTKKILSVAIYSHYNRLLYQEQSKDVSSHLKIELEKSNVLIVGESGTGKTLLASTLAKIVDVPFAIADATTLTEAGYVGDDVENILLRLIQNADFNIERAERGIIFIDEIDKIGRKSENTSITRDVSGEGVQQALLKIIEGTVASVPTKGGRRHPHGQNININTKNILFICGGAFVGLENIIRSTMQTQAIGFKKKITGNYNKEELFDHISTDSLIKYGLIPELVGRLSIITSLKKLNDKALRNILLKPKNALLKQYDALLKNTGVSLKVEESAILYIVEEAKKMGTGARALKSVVENIMLQIIYNAPEHKEEIVVLNKKNILENFYFYPAPPKRKASNQ